LFLRILPLFREVFALVDNQLAAFSKATFLRIDSSVSEMDSYPSIDLSSVLEQDPDNILKGCSRLR